MLSESIWQESPDTGRSTRSYIVFHQGRPIYHSIHVTGPVAQSSSESEYTVECTTGIYIAHFRMLNNAFLNNDLDVVPEQAPLIILDSKSDVFMAKNGKHTKHTRHISIIIHFVINS